MLKAIYDPRRGIIATGANMYTLLQLQDSFELKAYTVVYGNKNYIQLERCFNAVADFYLCYLYWEAPERIGLIK